MNENEKVSLQEQIKNIRSQRDDLDDEMYVIAVGMVVVLESILRDLERCENKMYEAERLFNEAYSSEVTGSVAEGITKDIGIVIDRIEYWMKITNETKHKANVRYDEVGREMGELAKKIYDLEASIGQNRSLIDDARIGINQ